MSPLLSLFAGGGLADLGAQQAGYQPVAAVEYDAAIAGVYAANLGDHITVARVQDVDYRPWAGVDAVWASPSCVRASVANQNAGEAPEDLECAAAIIRCLHETRPRVFALENVGPYRKFDAYRAIVAALLDMGYCVHQQMVNAADHGVPSTRRRLILRARRDGKEIISLERTHCDGGEQATLFGPGRLPWVGWYEAIEDLIPTLPVSRLANWQMARLPADLRTMLVSNSATQWGDGTRDAPAPALSVTGQHAGRLRAVLAPVNSSYEAVLIDGDGNRCRAERDPAPTVLGRGDKSIPPRAVLVDGQQISGAGSAGPPMHRRDDEPCYAVVSGTGIKGGGARAVLIGSYGMDGHQPREADEPAPAAPAVQASEGDRGHARAVAGHVVVQMTPRALARFQSVPDTYALPEKRALACRSATVCPACWPKP